MSRRSMRYGLLAILALTAPVGSATATAMKTMDVRYLKASLAVETPPDAAEAADQAPTPVAGAAPYRRLPSGYGKLGLSDRQRDRIYSLRGGYRARIQQLEAELAALKAAETEACESVLTEAQRETFVRGKKSTRQAIAP